MKRSLFLLPSLLAVSLSAAMPPTAIAADNCKDIRITLKNGTRDEIKVTKFEYFDFDKNKYRTENLLGLDGQQKLEPNKSITVTRNLEQIDNDRTKFKVTYQHKIGGNKFEPPVTEETPDFICKDNKSKTVFLNN
jgi:hypothetical protein